MKNQHAIWLAVLMMPLGRKNVTHTLTRIITKSVVTGHNRLFHSLEWKNTCVWLKRGAGSNNFSLRCAHVHVGVVCCCCCCCSSERMDAEYVCICNKTSTHNTYIRTSAYLLCASCYVCLSFVFFLVLLVLDSAKNINGRCCSTSMTSSRTQRQNTGLKSRRRKSLNRTGRRIISVH